MQPAAVAKGWGPSEQLWKKDLLPGERTGLEGTRDLGRAKGQWENGIRPKSQDSCLGSGVSRVNKSGGQKITAVFSCKAKQNPKAGLLQLATEPAVAELGLPHKSQP